MTGPKGREPPGQFFFFFFLFSIVAKRGKRTSLHSKNSQMFSHLVHLKGSVVVHPSTHSASVSPLIFSLAGGLVCGFPVPCRFPAVSYGPTLITAAGVHGVHLSAELLKHRGKEPPGGSVLLLA